MENTKCLGQSIVCFKTNILQEFVAHNKLYDQGLFINKQKRAMTFKQEKAITSP